MTSLSSGKLWGLRRLADERGLFRMLAVDQRPPIMNRLRSLRGAAPDAEVSAVKRLLVEELARHASATLVDPVWAWPFVWDVLDPRRGLVVTLESHAFADGPGGRRTASIPGWSVAKIRRMGGDAVKVLAYYRPDAAPEVIEHQKAYVRTVGEACRAQDLPFVLELLVHPLAAARPGGDYVEDPDKRPELVLESVRTFAAPEFGVDLFKLESPIPAEAVPDPDGPAAARVQALFDALGLAAGRPWVMLSAGAGRDAFRRVLAFAFRAGASGFLAGRAIWWEAFGAWPDAVAMRTRLREVSVPYLDSISGLAQARATPWHRHPAFAPDGPKLAGAGHDFAERFPETVSSGCTRLVVALSSDHTRRGDRPCCDLSWSSSPCASRHPRRPRRNAPPTSRAAATIRRSSATRARSSSRSRRRRSTSSSWRSAPT